MKTVPLGGSQAAGRVALIDAADAALLAGYSWYAELHRHTYYARAHVPGSGRYGRSVYMHHLLAGPGTDHRNRDGLDNQRSNLRPATVSQNNANARKHSCNGGGAPSSVFKGVADSGYSGWRAYIWRDSAQRYLGTFATEEDAARAYDAAAVAQWGEYALLNFPA